MKIMRTLLISAIAIVPMASAFAQGTGGPTQSDGAIQGRDPMVTGTTPARPNMTDPAGGGSASNPGMNSSGRGADSMNTGAPGRDDNPKSRDGSGR